MNFLELVKEALLLEDPDHAVFGDWTLRYNDLTARPFLVMTVDFLNPKSSEKGLFYSLEPGITHGDLYWMARIELDKKWTKNEKGWNPSWGVYPSSIKERMKEVARDWDPEKNPKEPYDVKRTKRQSDFNLVSGRYWIKDNKFLISFWKGKDSDIKKWINPVLPLWNPQNFPILYQAPGSEKWEDGNKFLTSSSSPSLKETPEIKKLQKEINKLLPQVHISTGEEKQKIKSQIRSLQNQIQSLGGRSSLSSGEALKGSYKAARIAGDMSIAQMKALSQTSESLKDVPLDPRYEYEYFRGISEEDLKEIQDKGHLLPSRDLIPEDEEVMEQVFGSDYYEMSERQLRSTLKSIIPWYDGRPSSLKNSVNLTKDFENAKGYGDYVVAVTIDPSYHVTDLSKVYAIANPFTSVKVGAIYDVSNRRWLS